MRISSLGMLAIALGISSNMASACTIVEPLSRQRVSQLVASADMVFVAHIEQILPLDSEAESMMRQLREGLKQGEDFFFPSQQARFAVVEAFKGVVPKDSFLESRLMSCDIKFESGTNYLIFSKAPMAGEGILPLRGSFEIHTMPTLESSSSRSIESFLSSQASESP